MPNFAHVTLIGHVGKDPVLRQTQSGDQVASFSLATSRKRQDQEITTWWNCSVWGKRANVITQYVAKGDAIQVVGEPVMRLYTDKDGYEARALDVHVADFTLLGNRRDGAQNGSGSADGDAPRRRPAETKNAAQASSAPAGYDDEIPFDVHQRGSVA